MRKTSNIKSKADDTIIARRAGKVSCVLGLLIFGTLIVAPDCLTTVSAISNDALTTASGQTNTSSVEITFSPLTGSSSITPVTSDGQATRFSINTRVRVQNSGGYSVYFGSDKDVLTHSNGKDVIQPIQGSVSYENLAPNTWGYALAHGSTLNPDAEYSAVTAKTMIDENASTLILNETKDYTLSFAAKVNNEAPAGTYSNTVTMSVISSPITVSNFLFDFGISYMQDMNSTICGNAPIGATAQLKDRRDEKSYWISRLKDGNCWMTQDLALDLSASQELTPEDSDISQKWHPGFDTSSELKSFSEDTMLAETRSWKQGLVAIDPIAINTGCNNSVEGQGIQTEGCRKVGFTDVAGFTKSDDPNFASNHGTSIDTINKIYDAHYLIGNYYQWNTAVAGTGFDASGEPLKSADADLQTGSEADFVDAPSSICPKGWRLPTSGRLDEDTYTDALSRKYSFKALLQHYEPSASKMDFETILKEPFYFHLGGGVVHGGFIVYPNQLGKYISSTAQPDPDFAYELGFWANGTNNDVFPSGNSPKIQGSLVRCVAR